MSDQHQHIRYHNESLEILDFQGEIDSLPDDFFLQYPSIKSLRISVKNLTTLPSSFGTLQALEACWLSDCKIKTLPENIGLLKNLESVTLGIGNMDINKEALKLATLPQLSSLQLSNWRGNDFPENLRLLTHLTNLDLSNDKKNEGKAPAIMALTGALPQLARLTLTLREKDILELLTPEHMPVLDKLEVLNLGYFGIYRSQELKLPICVAVTRNVKIVSAYEKTLPEFRQLTAGKNYTAEQLQLLFGLHLQNIPAINRLLDNQLANAITQQQRPVLRLLDKPKGESQKSIQEKLSKYGITVNNKSADTNTIVVVGTKTVMEEVLPLLDAGCQVITVDQLNEILIQQDDHWLLQDDNEEANTQLLRLFTSNDADNYHLAFQIIETGGANKTVQTLLAVVMLAHPDKAVAKKAEKLYDKFGSQGFRQHIKNLRPSLRVGGNTEWKLRNTLTNKDVDEVMFRLMYQVIAGANNNMAKITSDSFSMKGIANITLPPEIVYFTQITDWDFENCEGFNLEAAIPIFKEMPNLKHLRLNGCHIEIPASISGLTQLQTLEIAHNTLVADSSLQSMHSLQYLDATGLKIKNWSWLGSLKGLTKLILNNNQLKEVPPPVFDMSQLTRLELKQNKLAAIPEELARLNHLSYLDFSNNLISEFPYFLGRYQLKALLLRSNQIQEVDTHKLAAFANNRQVDWQEFNLSRNKLKELSFTSFKMIVRDFDISYNQLTVLHPSLFASKPQSFYAQHNQITEIPALEPGTRLSHLWLQNNLLTELPAHFAHVVVGNCDLSSNQISTIHPDFHKFGADRYQRLYWKLHNNPIPSGRIGDKYF
ncbi:leucine-rich repeat domain-containing protein [Chitinophaga sp. HK235]|uniref:leucine-rich repeat domain-containing protein n=1 Tax=Chitinophaga sp. HK235 TaxID=2952571 RepID=UPI001BAAE043|nr:hypothetical protein [Chitinophaga sp. HK235]